MGPGFFFATGSPQKDSTTPHSLQRRMGGLLVDWIVQWSVPRAFLVYRSSARTERGQVTQGFRQSIKHLEHADVCFERSRAAHHSEVCFVFGGCFQGYVVANFNFLLERRWG